MRSKCLMFQGTGSSVGKSLLTAALCRILKQDGYHIAPFKAQNMALNSYITADGCEMGRAQVVQAEACGLPPAVEMNPVLLKPTSDHRSQVIVLGKAIGNMNAVEYHHYKIQLKETVKKAYESLEAAYDYVIIEGAGSPAEINLKEGDLVNMGMAELADAPVLLIADAQRGGAFSALHGTLLLLTQEERARVKGLIVNKYPLERKEEFVEAISKFKEICDVPVVGLIPNIDCDIEDEDSVTERFRLNRSDVEQDALDVAVIRLPKISNFTDFNSLSLERGVNVRYVARVEELGEPDLIILPGSKNTMDDACFVMESGLGQRIVDHAQKGGAVIGICGGYQILARELSDPLRMESERGTIQGLGLLNMSVCFESEKITSQVHGEICSDKGLLKGLMGTVIVGYEIHMGRNTLFDDTDVWSLITQRSEQCSEPDGTTNEQGNVMGTYMHGLFDNAAFSRALINNLRKNKGLPPIEGEDISYAQYKQLEYDKLANNVRSALDMESVYKILRGEQ